MPLKLNVGLVRKVGLPNYSSVGASCHLEIELDAQLLNDDPQRFHDRVQHAFMACRQAVLDELVRQEAALAPAGQSAAIANGDCPPINGQGHRASPTGNGHLKANRPATMAQIRALQAIADRHELDLAKELQSRFAVDRLEALSIDEASRFIDELMLHGREHCRP